MNTDNYKPFVATGELLAKIEQFHQDRLASLAARDAIFKKYGASNGWGTDTGLSALVFDKPPDGWRRDKRTGAYKPPVGNAGKEIRKELDNSHILGGRDFSKVVGIGGSLSSSGNGGFCIRYGYYERIGETMILQVPKAETEWSHPDARPIKMSEYFALKESQPA